MTEPLRARPASPSPAPAPVAAATAVSLSATARSHPVVPAAPEPRSGEQHPLRLAGLAALFGLGRRRSANGEASLSHDDPYAAYLRWASGGTAAASAQDAQGTAAA